MSLRIGWDAVGDKLERFLGENFGNDNVFEKLFDSMKDPQTEMIYTRHMALAKYVMYCNKFGWRVSDVVYVNELLIMLYQYTSDNRIQFLTLLQNAIRICAMPLIRKKSNEEIACAEPLGKMLYILGEFLCCNDLQILQISLEALHFLCSQNCFTSYKDQFKCIQSGDGTGGNEQRRCLQVNAPDTRRTFMKNLLEKFGVMQHIVQLLHRVAAQLGTYYETYASEADNITISDYDESLDTLSLPILALVYELSAHGRCADAFIANGGVQDIIIVLDAVKEPKSLILTICLDILWNLLEQSNDRITHNRKYATKNAMLQDLRTINAAYVLCKEYPVRTLMRILQLLVDNAYRKQEKDSISQCLVIFSMLVERQNSIDILVESGLTFYLLNYAHAAKSYGLRDRKSHLVDEIVLQHGSGITEEDFELRRLLWVLITRLGLSSELSMDLLIRHNFVDLMLLYVQIPQDETMTSRTYEQIRIQRLLAFDILISLAPYVSDQSYTADIFQKILMVLQRDSADLSIQSRAWNTLGQLLSRFWKLEQAQAADILQYAIETIRDRQSPQVLGFAVFVCAKICQGHVANQKLFHDEEGVQEIMNFLDLNYVLDNVGSNNLVAMMFALRCCILGNDASERIFILGDGVYRLLDILYACKRPIRSQVLAILLDLSRNILLVPSFNSWRSFHGNENRSLNALQLLISIYKEEEAAMHRREALAAGSEQVWVLSAVKSCKSSNIEMVTRTSPVAQFADHASIATVQRGFTSAFSRLGEALKAAEGIHGVSSLSSSAKSDETNYMYSKSGPESKTGNCRMNCDMSKVSLILNALLCHLDQASLHELSAPERLHLEHGLEYITLQMGELWQHISTELDITGVRPTYSDRAHIQRCCEDAFNAAVNMRCTQSDILKSGKNRDSLTEDEFYKSLLQQRNHTLP